MKILFLILACFILPLVSFGQSHSGSAYNVYGLGTLQSASLSPFSSLGNTSIGIRSPFNINLVNPAALNSIVGFSHQFDFEIYSSFLNQRDSEAEAKSVLGGLNSINFWFRSSKRSAIAIGVKPFSKANYSVFDANNNSSIVGRYSLQYEGSGAINQFYTGFSQNLFKQLNLGVKFNFLFGNLNESQTISNNNLVGSATVDQTEYLKKAYFEFGGQYVYNPGWSKQSSLILGVTYRPTVFMNTKIEKLLIFEESDSVTSTSDGDMTLPENLGFGISLRHKGIMLAGDVNFTKWGIVDDGARNYEYQDQLKYSFGVEIWPQYASDIYFKRIDYRFGFSHSNYYLKINGATFSENSFHLGFGLPIKRGSGILNVGFEQNLTGTIQSNLIKESMHTITLGFSIRENWFIKTGYY